MTSPLPRHAFKDAQSLKASLDLLLDQHVCHHIPIAKDIAQTIKNMRTDYATQLSLIQTAIAHRYFKPSSYIKHYLSLVAMRAQLAVNYVFNLDHANFMAATSEAEQILLSARNDIRNSKSKLILG